MKNLTFKITVLVIIVGFGLASCTSSRPVCAAYIGPLVAEVQVDEVQEDEAQEELQELTKEAWPAKWSVEKLKE